MGTSRSHVGKNALRGERLVRNWHYCQCGRGQFQQFSWNVAWLFHASDEDEIKRKGAGSAWNPSGHTDLPPRDLMKLISASLYGRQEVCGGKGLAGVM